MKINLEVLPPVLHHLVHNLAESYRESIEGGAPLGAHVVVGRMSDQVIEHVPFSRRDDADIEDSLRNAQECAKEVRAEFAISITGAMVARAADAAEAANSPQDRAGQPAGEHEEAHSLQPVVLMIVETETATWISHSAVRLQEESGAGLSFDDLHFSRYGCLEHGGLINLLPPPERARMH